MMTQPHTTQPFYDLLKEELQKVQEMAKLLHELLSLVTDEHEYPLDLSEDVNELLIDMYIFRGERILGDTASARIKALGDPSVREKK